MKVTVTSKEERQILDSLFATYPKCENCGSVMEHSDKWYEVEIIPIINGGMVDMTCPNCGHNHPESFQFDYLPTLEAALKKAKVASDNESINQTMVSAIQSSPIQKQAPQAKKSTSSVAAGMYKRNSSSVQAKAMQNLRNRKNKGK